MMTTPLHAVAAALAFFWCGAVVSISFLEAWLKFKAPGVTLPVGLSIGRLVFSALNKIEWVLAIGCALCILLASGPWKPGTGCLIGATVLLLLETVWMLPALDQRAQIYLTGSAPPASRMHFVFIAAEALKVICLAIGGINLLNLIS